MAKKEETGHVLAQTLEDIMGDRFGRYSKYIIQERALPDARDGLKPVQRRILYAMNEDGNTFDKSYRKSAKTVGLVIGNYHPHGDSSVYDAMVRMSQSWKTRETLIDMHGNNGSIDDDPAAAMRYTEARLSKIASEMFKDIAQDTVEFAPNFDDETTEPTVLPARYPNLLVNGISGIAAGYATNIPPHNLGEVIDATIFRTKNPKCNLDELMEFVKGPDFPTGGIVQGLDGIKDAFTSGKGKVMVRGRVKSEKTKTTRQLVIYEIPYDVIKCNLVKKIDDIRINKQIDGMMDVRDESDRNGLKIVIDLKKDANEELILNYLYKHTDLQISFNYNTVAIVNKRPVLMGLESMLDAFIDHREDVITRRSEYELDKKEKRCHVLEGLIKAISVLDEIIALIRQSKDKGDAKKRISDKFGFSDAQAEAIVIMRLYRLSSTDVTLLQEEFALLVSEMEELRDILSNPKMLRKVLVNELKEIKNEYATPRLSELEEEIEDIVINQEDLIADEQVMLSVSRDGYIKRSSMRSFKASEDMSGLKEGDALIGQIEVSTLDTILFITSAGTYGYVKAYEVEEAKWKDVGSHLNSYIKIGPDEKIVATFALKDFKTAGTIITVSKGAMIKRSSIHEFEVSRKSKTMVAMKLAKDDEVVGASLAYANQDICVASSEGYISRYPMNLVPVTALRSKGVKAMNPGSGVVADVCVVDETVQYILALSESGAMKRIRLDEISVLGRPTRGDLIAKKVKSNPYILQNILAVGAKDQLVFNDGEYQTLDASEVAIMKKDSTYSNPITLAAPFSVIKPFVFIEQRDIVDDEDEEKVEYEEVTLDI